MRTWYRNLDYVSILLWIALVCVGLVALYSSTHGQASEYLLDSVRQNFNRQALWVFICAAGICIALLLPVRFYQNIAYPLYILSLLLLLFALVWGQEVNGAKSWLRIGGFQFQVSEFAKLGTLMAVSALLSTKRPGTNELNYAFYVTMLIMAPVVLILLQNDAGTALIFMSTIPFLLYWSGISLNRVLVLIVPALTAYLTIVYMPAAIVFSIVFIIYLVLRKSRVLVLVMSAVTNIGAIVMVKFALEFVLKPHHIARLVSFTNPEAPEYRYSVGFHLVQSKAAIGSGGLWGKGFLQGTQTQGAYVPEQTTDFVFSVIGEEFGFAGAILVLVLFAFLLIRFISMGSHIKHPFGNTFVVGVVAFYLAHIFFNIGMTTGILPVIGIPLPFLSYGGSALLTETAMLACVLNFYMRRDDFSIYGY
ncbi:MAG: rod shape-determining protein RodA [Bacteroidota bacterium]